MIHICKQIFILPNVRQLTYPLLCLNQRQMLQKHANNMINSQQWVRLLANSTPNSNNTHAKPSELKGKFITDDPALSHKQQLKKLITFYGPVAVVLHIGLSLSFLSLTYLAVRFGFDAPALLQKYNLMSEKYMMIIANGGTFGLAYAIYKALMPLRVLVTIFLVPPIASKLLKYGIIKQRQL